MVKRKIAGKSSRLRQRLLSCIGRLGKTRINPNIVGGIMRRKRSNKTEKLPNYRIVPCCFNCSKYDDSGGDYGDYADRCEEDGKKARPDGLCDKHD